MIVTGSLKDQPIPLCASEAEVVEQEAEEEQGHDPVDRVDVDDDEADVEEPAAHVGQVQGVQGEASVAEVPAPARHPGTPLLPWTQAGGKKN